MPALANSPQSAGQSGTGFVNLSDYIKANRGLDATAPMKQAQEAMTSSPLAGLDFSGGTARLDAPDYYAARQGQRDIKKTAEEIGGQTIGDFSKADTAGQQALNRALYGQTPGFAKGYEESQQKAVDALNQFYDTTQDFGIRFDPQGPPPTNLTGPMTGLGGQAPETTPQSLQELLRALQGVRGV